MRTVVADVCQENRTKTTRKEKKEAAACNSINSSNINSPSATSAFTATATNYLLKLSNLLVLRYVYIGSIKNKVRAISPAKRNAHCAVFRPDYS